MAKRKPANKQSAKPVTLPTEDQLRAEHIEEIKQPPDCELTERIEDDGLSVAGSRSLAEVVLSGSVLDDVALVAIQLKNRLADGEESLREYLTTLAPLEVDSLGRCLERLGWRLADDESWTPEQLVRWLFRDDVTQPEIDVNGKECIHIVTPKERIQEAVNGIASMANAVQIDATSCLAFARFVRETLDRMNQGGMPLPLGPRYRRSGSPDHTRFDANDIRFDGEWLNAALNAAASQLGLIPSRFEWRPSNEYTAEHRSHDDVEGLLNGWLDVLEHEIQARRELPDDWEPNGKAWPERPIQNVEHLRSWLVSWKRVIAKARSTTSEWAQRPESYLDDIRRELHNTRKALRMPWAKARGVSLPARFNDKPADIHEAEILLEDLVDGLEEVGNELNFDFPPKTPNHEFSMEHLKLAIQGLIMRLATQNTIGMNDPCIVWSECQWREDYWPDVRQGMEKVWEYLPEDAVDLYLKTPYTAKLFGNLEDCLIEIKHHYFESFSSVPHCPIERMLLETLDCYAGTVLLLPEPEEHQKKRKPTTSPAVPPKSVEPPVKGVPLDSEALSPHLDRVAVELADYANTTAIMNTTTASDRNSGVKSADLKSFRETSELVEELLQGLGREARDHLTGDVVRHCTGECLYRIVVEHKFISDVIASQLLSDQIIAAAGDRMTRYEGPLGDCWGGTSHNCAGTLLENIARPVNLKVWGAIGAPEDMLWPHWDQLSDASRSKVAAIELEHYSKSAGISELAASLRTERVLFLNRTESRPLHARIPDDKLLTVHDVASMLVDVNAKTLLNTDVKQWGPHHCKINRARVWRWGDIKHKVMKTRRLKEV